MSQQLTVSKPSFPTLAEIQTLKELGAVIRKSGFVPSSIKTDEQAVVILLKGQELGLPPMQAFASIAVINGKPTLTAEVMLGLIYRDHPKAQVTFVRTTNEVCTIEACRPGGKPSTFNFSLADAQQAGLLGKGPWESYPAAMLRARCISAMARAMFPDALSGCVYTPEELGANVDKDGEIVEVQSEVVEPAPTKRTETPKSTVSEPTVALPKAKDPSVGLQAAIERAKKGGPDAIAEAAKPAVELKWDGPLPSCMAAKVPFGKQKGTALVDLSMPEALAMADWIKAQAAKGKIPPTWVEFYFAVMDYEQSSQPLQETPQFGDEQQTSLAGVIR